MNLYADEIKRLKNNIIGENTNDICWFYDVQFEKIEDKDNLLQFMDLILNIMASKEDMYNSSIFPQWFLEQTPHISQEQAIIMMSKINQSEWSKLPWDFDSWIDALNDRQWFWWSYVVRENNMFIRLKIDSWPALLDTFEHILYSCNLKIIHKGPC